MRRYTPEPSPGQLRVLRFIRRFMDTQERPPTRREIADGLGFSSANAAEDHLKALRKKGYVELTPGIARGVRIADAHSCEEF